MIWRVLVLFFAQLSIAPLSSGTEDTPPLSSSREFQKSESLFMSLQVIPRGGGGGEKESQRRRRETKKSDYPECNPDKLGGDVMATSKTPNPLQCYKCQSFSKDAQPDCDVRLWKFLSQSEQVTYRERCLETRGHYCVLTAIQYPGRNMRRTIRGCHGAGPILLNGRRIPLKQGCMTYHEGDTLTTTCFCATDLCNAGITTGLHPPFQLLAIIFGLLISCPWKIL